MYVYIKVFFGILADSTISNYFLDIFTNFIQLKVKTLILVL